MRAGPGTLRTSAEPRPLRPAIGFAMQFTVSFDQRSPKRLVVTLAPATSFITPASRWARSLSLPSSSPILKPMGCLSVGVTGLVETCTDRDHTTERPPATGHRRYPL